MSILASILTVQTAAISLVVLMIAVTTMVGATWGEGGTLTTALLYAVSAIIILTSIIMSMLILDGTIEALHGTTCWSKDYRVIGLTARQRKKKFTPTIRQS